MEEAIGVGTYARYVIEPTDDGAYLFVFESRLSKVPERNYLQDSAEIAKGQALEDFGVPLASWQSFDGESICG